MKITNEQLKQIIKEELELVLNEGMYDTVKKFGKKVYGAIKREVEPVATGIKGAFEQDFRTALNKPENKKHKDALENAEFQLKIAKNDEEKKQAKDRVRAVVQVIKKQLGLDEGMQTLATAPLSQPDPNDHLFNIMDQVTNLALEKIGKRQDREAEAEISPLSNEVVTSMVNIEAMADEVLSRYNQGYKGESYE